MPEGLLSALDASLAALGWPAWAAVARFLFALSLGALPAAALASWMAVRRDGRRSEVLGEELDALLREGRRDEALDACHSACHSQPAALARLVAAGLDAAPFGDEPSRQAVARQEELEGAALRAAGTRIALAGGAAALLGLAVSLAAWWEEGRVQSAPALVGLMAAALAHVGAGLELQRGERHALASAARAETLLRLVARHKAAGQTPR